MEYVRRRASKRYFLLLIVTEKVIKDSIYSRTSINEAPRNGIHTDLGEMIKRNNKGRLDWYKQ